MLNSQKSHKCVFWYIPTCAWNLAQRNLFGRTRHWSTRKQSIPSHLQSHVTPSESSQVDFLILLLAQFIKVSTFNFKKTCLTFLPSRNLSAVPMLETQWILFSWRPCSHGLRQQGQDLQNKSTLLDIFFFNHQLKHENLLQVAILPTCSLTAAKKKAWLYGTVMKVPWEDSWGFS